MRRRSSRQEGLEVVGDHLRLPGLSVPRGPADVGCQDHVRQRRQRVIDRKPFPDEMVEARQDTAVIIHPLTDDRRILPLDKRGEIVHAHPDFRLVVSYNPGYQSVAKDLKPSTKQRFGGLDFNYPEEKIETDIVAHESGISRDTASKLVGVAHKSRALRGRGLEEGISTRMLIHAGALIAQGIEVHAACKLAMTTPITDDEDMQSALSGFIEAYFGLQTR